MPSICISAELVSQLATVDDAHLCDAAGIPLGHFLSEKRYRHLVYEWANAQISDDELQRRLQTPGGKMLSKIWAELEDE